MSKTFTSKSRQIALQLKEFSLLYLTTNRCYYLTSLQSCRQVLHWIQDTPTERSLYQRLNLTRKQYYTRINQLRDAGLITRKSTKFVLTSLGRVVYETHKTIGVAIQNRWRLQAIDSLENTLITHGMPTEERHKLINSLLGNCDNLREILLSTVMPNK